MRILVTNDDGIDSPGLHTLARMITDAGYDTVVAAPSTEQSGTGAAIGILRPDAPVETERVRIPNAPGLDAWAVAGTPALCALAARLGAFGLPPDLVVSGINLGLNTGRVVLHSGTVGAALTAQSFGGKGLAVSVAGSEPWQFEAAARCALEVIPMLVAAPTYSALNLNVPARVYSDIKGLRWARLAPFGAVRSAMTDHGDGTLRLELRPTDAVLPADSDTALCADGYATLTALVGIAEIWIGPNGHDLANTTVDLGHRVPSGTETHNVHSRLHA